MNIHPEGTTNNELAKKARVSKQTMSNVVKELTEGNDIRSETHGQDKRSSIIYLTLKGKKLVVSVRDRVTDLESEYEKVLDKKNLANQRHTAKAHRLPRLNDGLRSLKSRMEIMLLQKLYSTSSLELTITIRSLQ